MGTGSITSYVDVAQLVLYLFWVFFAGLIYYLIREGHREGYPMDSDRGVIEGWPRAPEPKTYKLADGSEVHVPRHEPALPPINAVPSSSWTGAPLDPVGNPLLAGVGPGAWVARRDIPDHGPDGNPKIVPLRTQPACGVSEKDPDPRGQPVYGGDGQMAGSVRDLWVDTGEMLFRYLEVQLSGSTGSVLLPMTFARVRKDGVEVHAILASQFAGVPTTRHPDQVTMLEEEKIQAYYGAGLLYAEPGRSEPLV